MNTPRNEYMYVAIISAFVSGVMVWPATNWSRRTKKTRFLAMTAGWRSRAVRWNRATVFLCLGKERWTLLSPIRVPMRCRPDGRNMDYNTGLEHGVSLVPSPTPPRRKLMLDSCLSEYVEALRGAISWLPHPWAMEIISSVPIYRWTVRRVNAAQRRLGHT